MVDEREKDAAGEAPQAGGPGKGAEAPKPKVASMHAAERRIERALSKSGVEHDSQAVSDALVPLYEAYELHGKAPTRESFAESCRDAAAGEAVKAMGKDPFRPTDARIPIACAVAAVAVVAVCAGVAVSSQRPADEPAQEPAAEEQAEPQAASVSAKVDVPGWDAATSTPVYVQVYAGDAKDALKSTDQAAPEPIAAKAIGAGEDASIDLSGHEGEVTVAVSSPILDDGTIFEVPDPVVVDPSQGGVDVALTPKDPSQVTQTEIDAAKDAAIAGGVDPSRAEELAGKVEQKAEEAQGGQVQPGEQTAQDKANGSAAEQKQEGAGQQQASSGGQAATGNSGGSGSNSGSTGQAQQHVHNWVAQYKTVHHPAVTKTVHHNAVYESRSVCQDCGAVTPSAAHMKQEVMNGGTGQVREERIKVKDAYDETVTVSSAYDETVVSGYRCSTCGATK